jgi:dihydroorotate dehydrogenase electron transfer subunit
VRVVAGFREEAQAAALDLIEPAASRGVALAPRLVTELVDLDGVERVLASGPGAMVRAVAALAAAAGVPCQVALEAPMACGFGACYGCAVELDGTWKRLCIEGPVVAAERLG